LYGGCRSLREAQGIAPVAALAGQRVIERGAMLAANGIRGRPKLMRSFCVDAAAAAWCAGVVRRL
jgi:hypothetical protein